LFARTSLKNTTNPASGIRVGNCAHIAFFAWPLVAKPSRPCSKTSNYKRLKAIRKSTIPCKLTSGNVPETGTSSLPGLVDYIGSYQSTVQFSSSPTSQTPSPGTFSSPVYNPDVYRSSAADMSPSSYQQLTNQVTYYPKGVYSV